MTTIQEYRRNTVPLYKDMRAYRAAYRAYARFVYGWIGSAYVLPGSLLSRELRSMRVNAL